MKIKRYDNFVESRFSNVANYETLNENLDKSRKFLKQRAMLRKAAEELRLIDSDLAYKIKEGDIKTLRLTDFPEDKQQELITKMREIKMSEEEARQLERDPEFTKLRELLDRNIGYLYNFVYMYYVEKTPFTEIEHMYNDIIELKPVLDMLQNIPEIGKKFDINFIDTTLPNKKDHRTNSEILAEGIDKLKEYKKVKKILDTLTSKLKQAYRDCAEIDKKGLAEVAVAFDEIPETPTKEKDATGQFITKKERIWKNFFGELGLDNDPLLPDGKPNPKFGKMVYRSRLKRFEDMTNPIRELVRAAKAHLAASMSDNYNERIEKIEKCNDKFGIMGCEIKFFEKGIMIVQVNSYAANQYLNSHCNHCIVNYPSYWSSYLGEFNKQYYIYNLNLSPMDDVSTIGVTIQPNRTWGGGACQSMRNNYIGDRFKKILKSWENEYDINADLFSKLEPMSDAEIEKRKRAKEAEREIVKKGITIEQIKKYVTVDGADINKDKAAALVNAASENDIEKVKLCLSLGASPNLAKGSEAAISKTSDLEIIKLLVQSGSDMPTDVFINISEDSKAMEFCLAAGLDPNLGSSLPFRVVCRGTYVDRENIGHSHLASFNLLMKYGAKMTDERGRVMIIKWAAEFGRIDILQSLVDKGHTFEASDWRIAAIWIAHARKLPEKVKEETIDFLNNQADSMEKK